MKNKQANQKNKAVLSFDPVIKYIIWFYILIMITELLVSGFYVASSLKKEAKFVSNTAKVQVEYRIKQTVRLLTALAEDPYFSNTTISFPQKAEKLTNYSRNFGYMMICILDKEMNVWDEEGSNANLGGRDYMQKLFATGDVQVTDSFASGSDGVTLNYTIAAPIMKNNEVDGCLFAAIYFDEIESILKSNTYDTYQELALFGSQKQVMSIPNVDKYGKTYLELAENVNLFGTTAKQIEENMYNGTPSHHWGLENGNIDYAVYYPIENTSWTIFCKVSFWGMLTQFINQIISMLIISTLICIFMVFLAKKYIYSQMSTVNMLIESVQELEKKIYQNEKPDDVDFSEIISLTSKGLTDSLTGVITRTVFLSQIPNKIRTIQAGKIAALCFVDVDNLKTINDTYGHGVGDITLKNIGYVLREYEKKYDGLVGRHGGDEFILWMNGFDSRENLEYLLDELCIRLHVEISVDKTIIKTHCSLGVSLCTAQDKNPEILIANADEALYFVKQHEKGSYKIYED